MSRVPREGRPQKRAKKNVSTQKAKKKKKTTLERRVASVTRGSHVSRVFSPLSAFSLCHEKKTRQRKRRLLLRVYVQLRFYETCVYVIENKKRIERLFSIFVGEKVNTKNMTFPLVLAFVFLVFVCRDHERDALFVVRCEEEEEEKRRTTPVVLLPRVAWSMREKRCIDQTPFASQNRFREDFGFVLEKVVPTFCCAGGEELAMWSNAAKRRERVAFCDDEEEEEEDDDESSQTRRDDDALAAIVDAVLKKHSVELKPKEHLYVNTSSMVSTFDGNGIATTVQKRGGSFEITYVPTSNMRRANASNASTIWTIEDSFENYVSNDASTAAVGARESCDQWPGTPPRFRVRYGPKYFMDGIENVMKDVIVVETHVTCQQYIFVAPSDVMFQKNPVFANASRLLNTTDDDENESYLAVSLVVSIQIIYPNGVDATSSLLVKVFVNGQPLSLATMQNVPFQSSYSSPATNVLSKFIRLGDHCCFDGHVKYFAVYDETLNASDVKVLYNARHRERMPKTILTNTPSVVDVVVEDDGYEKREIQVLVIDTDEIHDAFKIALIQSPLAGRVGSCESSALTFCAGARCVFCYYPPHQLRTASMSSTSTFIEFVVLPFDANVTEYQTSEVDSAKMRVTFNLLPPLLACIFREDVERDTFSKFCSTKANTILLNITEDEDTIIRVCVNDTRTSSLSIPSDWRNEHFNFVRFPVRGAAYWRGMHTGIIEVDGRVFACARFSYAPVKNYHGSDIATVRIASTNSGANVTLIKQIVFNVINIEDAKTLVVVPSKKKKNEDVVDWMSRVDLSHSVTISNAGIDSDAFSVRVSIDSTLRNLIFMTNDTALDALTSLPLLRGDGGGDPKIEFEAMPSVANALLESMEYLNVYSGRHNLDDDDDDGYINDTVTVRISSVAHPATLQSSETSMRLRVKPPSIESYRLALMNNTFEDDENKTFATLLGMLAALCVLGLQLANLRRLKIKS